MPVRVRGVIHNQAWHVEGRLRAHEPRSEESRTTEKLGINLVARGARVNISIHSTVQDCKDVKYTKVHITFMIEQRWINQPSRVLDKTSNGDTRYAVVDVESPQPPTTTTRIYYHYTAIRVYSRPRQIPGI